MFNVLASKKELEDRVAQLEAELTASGKPVPAPPKPLAKLFKSTAELEAEIDSLTKENAVLKSELAELKKARASATAAAKPTAVPSSASFAASIRNQFDRALASGDRMKAGKLLREGGQALRSQFMTFRPGKFANRKPVTVQP
jgi:molecular chaperone GrpE (heat shock protein)